MGTSYNQYAAMTVSQREVAHVYKKIRGGFRNLSKLFAITVNDTKILIFI